jgi:hypothetical protein
MGIEITKRGRMPKFNAEGIAREIQRFAPGAIIERTGRGLDLKGQPFAGYSARYRRQLKRMGEDPKVDLRMSGGLLNSVKARDATLRADSVEVVIAPDTGTSPQYRAPSERRAYRQAGLAEGRFAERGVARTLTKAEGRAFAKSLKYEQAGARRIDTGRRSPEHNVVGYWLHYGTPKMRARPWMGLDPSQEAYLFARIAKIMWK